MSPRAGGEADKFGSRYEGAWTVSHLLYILSGSGRSIVVEKAGEIDDGAEFLYTRDTDGVVEAHQLKRQNGTANSWTVKSLVAEKIWSNARKHTDAGREFHFVSTVPAANLTDLADRARRATDVDDFVKNWLNEPLRLAFDQLVAHTVYGSPHSAWTVLRKMWFRCEDERAITNMNAAMSQVLLEGANGRLASVGLGDLVLNQLGVSLSFSTIESQLATYSLALMGSSRRQAVASRVDRITSNWLASIGAELLSPKIVRTEAAAIADAAVNGAGSVTFVIGTAGGGKSAVLSQAADHLAAQGICVLGFRLDRMDQADTTEHLGAKVGLSISPVSALASAAGTGRSVLIVDQLDAVSLASGRMPCGIL